MTLIAKLAAGAASALLLAACATPPDPAPEIAEVETVQAIIAEPSPPPPGLTDAQIWRTDGAGNQTHIQSGLLCPASWGEMKRQSSDIFNRSGQDVGCNYVDSHGSIITFYAYHNPASPAVEVASIMDQIVRARHPVHQPFVLTALTSFPMRGDFAVDSILFNDANGTALISGVATNEFSGWRLKFRYTFRESQAERIEAFLLASIMGQQDSVAAVAKAEENAGAKDTTF